ncbi:MAG: ABC transporter permease [Oscillospiraceae bacterium]|nr:ABC transporter permease [Oscillospiraceae bacterium]
MSLLAFRGAIEQGMIYSLVAIALFVSYRILDIADLTTDGTFTLGAAASAIFTTFGTPWLGLGLAVIMGAAAGFVTALLQTKLKVQPILAGIITMTALYSINLIVMGGKSNLPLMKKSTVFTFFETLFGKNYGKLIFIVIVVTLLCALLAFFLRTRLGLSIRATGDNKDMVRSSSINPAFTITIGLMLANAITALSGALFAQHQQFSDISLGTGMVVVGLASLIIGEVIIGTSTIPRCIIGAVVGSIIYRIIIAFALNTNISASNLKLVSAIIVAIAISYPAIKEQIAFYKLRKAGRNHVNTK